MVLNNAVKVKGKLRGVLLSPGSFKCFGSPSQTAFDSSKFQRSVSWSVCSNFNICNNFFNIQDSNLIFRMHVYLIEVHILSGKRSRLSFKVRGQIFVAKIAHFINTFAILKIAT